ncbi:MAG: PRD domain-containing protein [Flaviflexus sp.]|nr:PRD domain-containing protein [Flaviflexus sp.]
MDGTCLRVRRVFNNNALLVVSGDAERVVVGRGIGFGRRAGDLIQSDPSSRQYVEVSPDRIDFFEHLDQLGPRASEAISHAVDLAADVLGELHPSVYLLLADHLVFAVRRLSEGEIITNPLLSEIRGAFPEEFNAAILAVQYLNTHLEVEVPLDEAAFIALHLNAARRGVTVKQPLQQANELAAIVAEAQRLIGQPQKVDGELIGHLARLAGRLHRGEFRANAAQRSIIRDLPKEAALAERILTRILGSLDPKAQGEVAYLAVFLHGWHNTPSHD